MISLYLVSYNDDRKGSIIEVRLMMYKSYFMRKKHNGNLLYGVIISVLLVSFSPWQVLANEPQKGKKSETAKHIQTIYKNKKTPEKMADYLDNRSSPVTLIESYYNAINRKEYARAYSYYSEEGRDPHFNDYVNGYKNTKSVIIKAKETEADPGAGQIYWSIPIAIEAEGYDGTKSVFTGCYTLRMTNPAMQEKPPFKPLEIMTGSLTPSPLSLEKSVPDGCEAP